MVGISSDTVARVRASVAIQDDGVNCGSITCVQPSIMQVTDMNTAPMW